MKVTQLIESEIHEWVNKQTKTNYHLARYQKEAFQIAMLAAEYLYSGMINESNIPEFLKSRIKFCPASQLIGLKPLIIRLLEEVVEPQQKQKNEKIISEHEALEKHLDEQRHEGKLLPEDYASELDWIDQQNLGEIEISQDKVIAKSFSFEEGLYKHLWKTCPEMMKKQNRYLKGFEYLGTVGSSAWVCPRSMEEEVVKAMQSFFGQDRCPVVRHPNA